MREFSVWLRKQRIILEIVTVFLVEIILFLIKTSILFMEWDELYAKYGQPKQRKNKLIFVVIAVLLVCAVFIVFFIVSKKLAIFGVSCDEPIQKVNSIIYKSDFSIKSDLENSLQTICDFKVLSRTETILDVNISNCNTTKIDIGIDNLTSLTLDELNAYTQISLIYSLKELGSYLKNILEQEASTGCDAYKKLSFDSYMPIFVGVAGVAYAFHSGLISICMSNTNFTEYEKRECLIDLLNAEKAVVDQYSSLDYTGDVNKCVSASGASSTVCQKMIDYRKKLAESIKKGSMNYNQKYFAFLTLLYQNTYLGGGEIDNKPMDDIINNLNNSKYKPRFIQFR
jgi:flagellar basal body-associated protein FliL